MTLAATAHQLTTCTNTGLSEEPGYLAESIARRLAPRCDGWCEGAGSEYHIRYRPREVRYDEHHYEPGGRSTSRANTCLTCQLRQTYFRRKFRRIRTNQYRLTQHPAMLKEPAMVARIWISYFRSLAKAAVVLIVTAQCMCSRLSES